MRGRFPENAFLPMTNGNGHTPPATTPPASPPSAQATTIKPTDLRGILQYVPRFQGQIFVIAVDGSIVADENFGNLLVDIAVLRSLNIHIVLVHGAFADGSSWLKVTPLLQELGYHVVAVQNPMTSLADEVAFTKRIIALQDGPVVLVGHSWGGAVIMQAGDDPKVGGLVYVAAYAPEVGQSANDASSPFGWTEGQKQIRVDSEKFGTVTSGGMLEDIAQGLPMIERQLALAVQGQSYGPMFDEKLTVAAWKTKPCWAIISANDGGPVGAASSVPFRKPASCNACAASLTPSLNGP